jgi:hypothetical protein
MLATRKMVLPILLSVAALGALALSVPALSTAATPASRGVTLLQLGCAEDPSQGSLFGPVTAGLSPGAKYCDGEGNPGDLPLPPGRLYHFRASLSLGTVDGSNPNAQAVLVVNGAATALACTYNVAASPNCEDLSHQVIVKSGDAVEVHVTLPDSNTWMIGGVATIEEAIYE